MGIIILLIAISVTIAVVFLAVFLWAIRSGQYDDTYTPSVRVLFESQKKKNAAGHVPEKDQGVEQKFYAGNKGRQQEQKPDQNQVFV